MMLLHYFNAFLVRAVLLFLCALAMPVLANEPAISIENAWVRAVPPVSATTAAYFTATNNGDAAIRITGVSTEIAGAAEMHDMSPNEDGTRSMRRMKTLTLAPNESVTFSPGGMHLMLFRLNHVPVEGESVSICLLADDAMEICQDFVTKK
ncbi:MAG: copper chaperone PCu(A)C [Alcanivoracaceae bacterium]|nr:copper chaperone PCu(A)C [Alcanivoracaceae bacterium]